MRRRPALPSGGGHPLRVHPHALLLLLLARHLLLLRVHPHPGIHPTASPAASLLLLHEEELPLLWCHAVYPSAHGSHPTPAPAG
jgi:hypothetical protein